MRTAILLLAALSLPAAAQEDPLAKLQADARVLGLASELAVVLGSETFCGLTFDQPAIAAWIAANVPPDRLDFAPQLQLMTMGQAGLQQGMTPSGTTAHCAAVTQSARHYGFIAP